MWVLNKKVFFFEEFSVEKNEIYENRRGTRWVFECTKRDRGDIGM